MRAVAFSLAAMLFSGIAAAQGFPNKPVHLILPYTAGGMIDVVARTVADKLTRMWGQPVIVEARPGANGNLAADYVLKSAPDGHTWLIQGTALMANPALYGGRLNWDPVKDFAGIAALVWPHSVFVVPASLPVSTLKEFVAYAKAHPGLPYANPGTGSSLHLGAEVFKQVAGIDLNPIGYKGQSQTISDTLSGEIAFNVLAIGLAAPDIKSGKLKPLAVVARRRSKVLPEVPTLSEAGYPDAAVIPWYVLVTGSGAPKEVIAKFNADINRVMISPEVIEKLENLGGEMMDAMKPAEIDALIRTDVERWGNVIRKAGIKAE